MSRNLRARVDRLDRGGPTAVWIMDTTTDGDGRCRPAGPEHDAHPGVTVAELDARPDRHRITLIEFTYDLGEA
jgi:hypothetical protein